MGRALRKAKPVPRSAKAVRSKASPAVEIPEYSVTREASSILLLVFAIFLSASLYSYLYPTMSQADLRQPSNVMGPVGAAIAEILFSLLGWCSAVTVVWALILARAVWKGRCPVSSNFLSVSLSVFASMLMAVSCATAASVILGFEGGGVIGSSIAFFTVRYVNEAGTLLLSVALFLVSFGITTGLGTATVLAMFKSLGKSAGHVAVDTVFVVERGGNSVWSAIHACIRGCILSVVSLWRGLLLSWRGVSNIGHLSKRAIRWTIATIAGGRDIETDEELLSENFVLGSGDISRTRRSVKETVDLEDEDEEPEEIDPDNVIISRRNSTVARTQGARRGALRSKLAALSKRKPTDYSTFTLPSTALLNASDATTSVGPKDSELLQNGLRLEQALSNFRIGGKVVEVQPGPVVTLYQFEPAPGVKVQKIISLADDLALALKVASVRVYAPVPGKGTVGIEVPNAQREMVLLRDVLEVDEFLQATAPLTLALGKNTFGDPFVADLSKMPHLLIAGATGSGKSVCINSILLSLLYRNTPEDLRLIMIDPKMLELSIYEDIPHLKAPVVTSPKRARAVLWWAVEEMERRYKLMKDLGVRNIAGYNAAIGKEEESLLDDDAVLDLDEVTPILGQERLGNNSAKEASTECNLDDAEPLPRIVIVVDELADLMLTVGREIEELLARLAQKARAAGIHLILATQRPSVNVITGLIKANFPARISFKVASRIDSRTILDGSGSEKLLGHGDMLFMSPMTGRIKRLHAPFVSDNEVVDVVSWLRKQGAPDYDQNISRVIEKFEEQEQGGGAGLDDGDYDPLYDQAVQLVVEKGQASTSMVQRAFRIGYNRAARILDAMESDGVVGPADGSRPRDVLLRQDDRI